MNELRRVLEKLHDFEAKSGTLSVDELTALKEIIDNLVGYNPLKIDELESNLDEATGVIDRLTAHNLELLQGIRKAKDELARIPLKTSGIGGG